MSTSDRPDFFENDQEMRQRYETVYEFLADSGAAYGLSKEYMLQVLHYIGEAMHMNTANESLWKAYVLLDVLVDRWDECVVTFIEEEKAHDRDD